MTNPLLSGAIVSAFDRSFSLQAPSVSDVERILCEYVRHGKLAAARIYQICPSIGNPEAIRSIAISGLGSTRRVLLDAVQGRYSEFKRIRYAEEKQTVEDLTLEPESIPA